MNEFPTGFVINGGEKAEQNTLRVKLPTGGREVQFFRITNGRMRVSIRDGDSVHTIGQNVPIKSCKNILDFLCIPHKEMTMKTLRKEIKKFVPKKRHIK